MRFGFAGLDGFHLALGRLGHKCVFACEIIDGTTFVFQSKFVPKPRRSEWLPLLFEKIRMDELEYLPDASTRAFKALGNAVNVDLVEVIAKVLTMNGASPSYS